jgi:hypothetical protein
MREFTPCAGDYEIYRKVASACRSAKEPATKDIFDYNYNILLMV